MVELKAFLDPNPKLSLAWEGPLVWIERQHLAKAAHVIQKTNGFAPLCIGFTIPQGLILHYGFSERLGSIAFSVRVFLPSEATECDSLSGFWPSLAFDEQLLTQAYGVIFHGEPSDILVRFVLGTESECTV